MITKEDALGYAGIKYVTVVSLPKEQLFSAMDKFSKEIAIGFAKYAMLNTYQDMNVLDLEGHPDTWSALDYGDQTTEQLFQTYLNTLQ